MRSAVDVTQITCEPLCHEPQEPFDFVESGGRNFIRFDSNGNRSRKGGVDHLHVVLFINPWIGVVGSLF